MFDPGRPYNDLPTLPPAGDIETRAVLKKTISARAVLAELRIAGQLIPNPSVLVHAIPVLEARDSSAIENIVTTKDALFRATSEAEIANDPSAKEASRYCACLYHGLAALKQRPLSTNTALEICRIITGVDIDIRRIPGTSLHDSHTGEIVYTPPEGEPLLRQLMANWEAVLHAEGDLDPIVRMAVLHYQFEAIHPFPDGNGRTGRVLNILTLIAAGLLDLPTLYLSRHILRTRGDYYRLLGRVTAHREWDGWVLYMLDAVET